MPEICCNRYDMASLQASMLAFLYQRFPAELSPDPRHEGYVMAWLALADELQIDELRSVCLRFVRGLAFNGRLEDTLLQRVIPAGGVGGWGRTLCLRNLPQKVGRGGAYPHLHQPIVSCTSSALGSSPESSALRRVNSLRRISSGGPEISPGRGSSGGAPSGPATWHQDDQPELHDSLRTLSRGTLEELLGSLAMAASSKYQNMSRCDAAKEGAGAAVLPTQV